MDEKKLGPLLSDEQFFGECLNLDYPGMEAVKEAVARVRIIVLPERKWHLIFAKH